VSRFFTAHYRLAHWRDGRPLKFVVITALGCVAPNVCMFRTKLRLFKIKKKHLFTLAGSCLTKTGLRGTAKHSHRHRDSRSVQLVLFA